VSKSAAAIAVALLGPVLVAPGSFSAAAPTASLAIRTVVPEPGRPPSASAGSDDVVLVGQAVEFHGLASSPEDEIVEYAWDFESDGIPDFVDARTGFTTHVFAHTGDYRCLFAVRDSRGGTAQAIRHLIVVAQAVDPVAARRMLHPTKAHLTRPPDGVKHRYAILINGASEERFWTDVELAYDMLLNGYGFGASDIYLLNCSGTDPQGGNPAGMIDAPARIQNLQAAFDSVAARSDLDDEVFLWITDHGRGQDGPLSQGGKYLGYLDGRASVDPGDEPDFLESNFRLRGLATGGDYYPNCNHGLNSWQCYKGYYSATKTRFWRRKFVSRLDNVYVRSVGGTVSDNDVYIEVLTDYAAGDTNRDGYIDTSLGEVFDYDGDGAAPYNSSTGVFDEGDWGDIDAWTDDLAYLNTGVPVDASPYRIFDANFEGKLCIDLGYAGGALHVDGRDEDNAGLFDWMDVNQDGDVADTVSVDEAVCLQSGDLYDDELAALVDQLSVAKVTVVAEQCFSGGLVEDLTSPTRVICTATIEDAVSWGNLFIRSFVAALHGQDENGMTVDADSDGDHRVSMLDAFNYAAGADYCDEIPQYDDDGDGVSHTDPVPVAGDGALGAGSYLADPGAVTVATPVFTPGGGTYDSAVVVTISCVAPLATIYFTTDGSEPTTSSPTYTTPLQVAHRLVLKARAYFPGSLPSAVEQAAYFLPGDRIIRVSSGGDDQNDGLTWGAAKRTIGDAVRAAGAGGDIWVRGQTASPYHERITVPPDVALYGGFRGTEGLVSQRPAFPRAEGDSCTSVIDGDQLGTVVSFSSGASAVTMVDGFTIRNGRASSGGGMRADVGSPVVRNCTITDNTATYTGGGIYCLSYARTRIENCVIASNHADVGGGLDISNSNPIIANCTIASNTASPFGGGIYSYSHLLGDGSTPLFLNCAITGNSSGQDGGGAYFRECAPRMINCTMNANASSYGGGGIYCEDSRLSIVNSILWSDHTAYFGHELRILGTSRVAVSYSDVSGGASGASIGSGAVLVWGDGGLSSDPMFVDPNGADDDPATWADNDHGLQSGSPCIDAGDNDAVPSGTLVDLYGHPRFANDHEVEPDPGHGTPPIVDMGAGEHQGAVTGAAEEQLALAVPWLQETRPNPFTSVTVVRYILPRACTVRLCVYDARGRLVRVLVDEPSKAGGMYLATWDGRNQAGSRVGSGIYLCRLEVSGLRVVRKLVLLR
jgi:parallel beta-helix repeat protein